MTFVFLVVVIVLAVWKVHDLLFPPKSEARIKELEQTIFYQSVFFAEYINKMVNNLEDYEEVPKEMNDWVISQFREWAEGYTARLLSSMDKHE